jgi:hypothetical protein
VRPSDNDNDGGDKNDNDQDTKATEDVDTTAAVKQWALRFT